MRLFKLNVLIVVVGLNSAATSRACADLIVSSFLDNSVKRYNETTGTFIDSIISSGSGGLTGPDGVILGPDGNIYVASRGSLGGPNDTRVLRYNGSTGAFMDVFATGLDGPVGLLFGYDGNLYVSSAFDGTINRYDGTTGAFIDFFATGIGGPTGMVFGPGGDLFVSAFGSNLVHRFDGSTGASEGVFASSGGLSEPEGLVFGPDGNLYISSRGSDQVLRYNGVTGAFIDVFASGSGLNGPVGLLFGPDANLYVSSTFNDRVKRYNGQTGAFMDNFVTFQSGGLDGPTYLFFSETSPTTLNIVPEPSTLGLAAIGSVGLIGCLRRKRVPDPVVSPSPSGEHAQITFQPVGRIPTTLKTVAGSVFST